MRIHMPHFHLPDLEDKQVKSLGRAVVALAIVGLVMATLVTMFLHGSPPPPPRGVFLQ